MVIRHLSENETIQPGVLQATVPAHSHRPSSQQGKPAPLTRVSAPKATEPDLMMLTEGTQYPHNTQVLITRTCSMALPLHLHAATSLLPHPEAQPVTSVCSSIARHISHSADTVMFLPEETLDKSVSPFLATTSIEQCGMMHFVRKNIPAALQYPFSSVVLSNDAFQCARRYRLSPLESPECDKQITRFLANGWISLPTSSPSLIPVCTRR